MNLILKLIMEKKYYVQTYTDEEVKAGERIGTIPGGYFNPDQYIFGSIGFIVHEVFHIYQEETWTNNWGNGGHDFEFNPEIYALRALTHQIFKKFP